MLPYHFLVRIGFLFSVAEIAFNANKLCACVQCPMSNEITVGSPNMAKTTNFLIKIVCLIYQLESQFQ